MERLPHEITLCTLEVVAMPNGEVICFGKRVGWFRDLKNALTKKEEGPQQINKELLEALKLAVHALNRKPCFAVNCQDEKIKNSYQIAAICDRAIEKAVKP